MQCKCEPTRQLRRFVRFFVSSIEKEAQENEKGKGETAHVLHKCSLTRFNEESKSKSKHAITFVLGPS